MGKGSSFSMLGEVSRLIRGKNTSRRKSVASLSTRPSTMSLNLRLAMVGTWSRMVLRNKSIHIFSFWIDQKGHHKISNRGLAAVGVAETHHYTELHDEEAPRSHFQYLVCMYYRTRTAYSAISLFCTACIISLSYCCYSNHLPSSCPTSPSK